MDIPAAIELASKYLLVPEYYTQREKELALVVMLGALVGWGIATFLVPATKLKASKIVALIVFAAAGTIYWLCLNIGGIFGWQIILRVLFFIALGAVLGKTSEKSESK